MMALMESMGKMVQTDKMVLQVLMVQGPQGPQGPAGNDGTNGAMGKMVQTDKTGAPGADGAQRRTCWNDGTNGADGQDGLDGYTTLVASTFEPPGINCFVGGTRIDSGIDWNQNAILEVSEITTTSMSVTDRMESTAKMV